MKYKITSINKQQGWVALTVTFDDNTTYNKRMMAPMYSEDAIHEAIQQWLADYSSVKEQEPSFDPKGLVNKTTSITVEELPKTSQELNEEMEAAKAEAQSSETP